MDIYQYWNSRRRKTRALKFENNNVVNSSIIFTDVPQLSNTGDVRIDLKYLKERINGSLYDDLTGRHIQTENRKFDDYVKNNSINPVALGLPVR